MVEESFLPMRSRMAGLVQHFGQKVLQALNPTGELPRWRRKLDEPMDVIGHQDISANKNVPQQCLLAELDEGVMNVRVMENGLASFGAESDEANWIFDIQLIEAVQTFHEICGGHRPPLQQSALIWLAA